VHVRNGRVAHASRALVAGGISARAPKLARESACAPQSSRTYAELFAGTALQRSACVFPIEFRDKTGADLSGTNRFALVSVGAIAKSFRIHHAHHFQNAPYALGISLRQQR
jgi:hypothetical protein